MFPELKENFIKELVLAVPDLDNKMKIEVDTLDYTIGKVLSMKYENRKWRLVTYLLKSLNETKKNYDIYLKFGQIIKT